MANTTKEFISETQLKIMGLFTKGFDREYYIREVTRLLNISPRTAQLNLEDLERKGLLEAATKGKIKLYKLKKNRVLYDYLIIVEIYKKLVFLDKHVVMKEIVDKISPHIEGIGIIFGSYAKGTEKKDSDLDIFIVGNYKRKEIEKIADLYNINISIKNYPIAIFKKGIREDILIKEIFNNHIIFKGTEQFIEMIK